ncbi:MAG: head GIN domain-containing protein [Pseudomonadota bacterium]
MSVFRTAGLVAAAAVLSGCINIIEARTDGSSDYVYDGDIVDTVFDVGPFDGIRAGSGLDVVFEQSDDFVVVAEGGPRQLENVDAYVEDGVLRLSQDNRVGADFYVSAPVLTSIDVSGGADFIAEDLELDEIYLEASGGADLEVSGVCAVVTARASSGADIEAGDLKCARADVKASSGGDVEVYASRSAEAEASTGGDVDVRGAPDDVESTESFGGDVTIEG